MGPLAGLAAGLGIAALFSHFGMGEGLANFMMIALLAVAAFFVIRFLLARFAGGAKPETLDDRAIGENEKSGGERFGPGIGLMCGHGRSTRFARPRARRLRRAGAH